MHNCLTKKLLKTAGEGDTYPSSHAPRSVPGHKVRRPLKYSGIFQSLSIICSFLLRQSQKGEAMAQCPPPKYAPTGKGFLFLLKKEKFNQRCCTLET